MALRTLGTNTTTSLTAVVWASPAVSQADVAAINTLIKDDQNARHPRAQVDGCGGFVKEGILYVPNRGLLKLFPNDIVALDATSGQVILLTNYGRTTGPWTLT